MYKNTMHIFQTKNLKQRSSCWHNRGIGINAIIFQEIRIVVVELRLWWLLHIFDEIYLHSYFFLPPFFVLKRFWFTSMSKCCCVFTRLIFFLIFTFVIWCFVYDYKARRVGYLVRNVLDLYCQFFVFYINVCLHLECSKLGNKFLILEGFTCLNTHMEMKIGCVTADWEVKELKWVLNRLEIKPVFKALEMDDREWMGFKKLCHLTALLEMKKKSFRERIENVHLANIPAQIPFIKEFLVFKIDINKNHYKFMTNSFDQNP